MRRKPLAEVRTPTRVPPPATEPARGEGDWHTEARVRAMVIEHLIREGWHIDRSADTATREHGIDVIGTETAEAVAIKVKGCPGEGYADPRAGQASRSGRGPTGSPRSGIAARSWPR